MQVPAKEGASFRMKRSLARLTVGPKCGTNVGNWVCVTCGEAFANNMEMWGHAEGKKKHVVAWNCHVHGPEVP